MPTNEGITVHDDGAISIVGPDAVSMYAWLTTRRALAFEVAHPGMKMTRFSALQAAKRNGFVPANVRTKQQALDYMNAAADEAGLEKA
jgi:hypothetical protein